MNKLKLIIIFFAITLAQKAQSNQCGKFLSNLSAPVCTDARYFFLIGSGLTYASYKAHRSDGERMRFQVAKKRPLKDWGKVGNLLGWGGPNAAYFLYQLIKGYSKEDQYSLESAELMAEASIYTSLVTLLLKSAFQAERPDGDGMDSFPSGHSSSSFAWASVVMIRHEWYYGLAAYAVASYIAFSRINDQRHHFHDVYGGITLGVSYAWGIYFNHARHSKDFWMTAVPTNDMKGLSLNASVNF